MKNINFRVLLSAICVASVLAGFTGVNAGPVRFNQVVTILDAKPGRADTAIVGSDDDDKKKSEGQTRQDNRVITETRSEIVEDDACDCVEPTHRGFPKWVLLGLAAIPIAFILIRHKETPTPTATVPNMSPTPTPPISPTPTPPMSPTPTPPQPVPEPVTILLFGTGLASIGMAARRKFGKKGERKDEKDGE